MKFSLGLFVLLFSSLGFSTPVIGQDELACYVVSIGSSAQNTMWAQINCFDAQFVVETAQPDLKALLVSAKTTNSEIQFSALEDSNANGRKELISLWIKP